MRVLVIPGDPGRCGHRLIWPAQALQARGYDVTISAVDDPDRADPDGWLRWARDFDVIVVQRAMTRDQLHQVRAWKAFGVCVVMDLDDNFKRIDRSNAMYDIVHPRTSPDSNFRLLDETMRVVDLLTCTTPAIARDYARAGRYRIIPNHIPAWYLTIGHEAIGDRLHVGWTGSLITHGGDLNVTGGAISRVLAKTGAGMAIVGDGNFVHDALWLDVNIKCCGWLPLDEYPIAMAGFDVGIVPLKPSLFNESKSTLKGLEMASVGVPFVSSPTEPYRGLSGHCGMLAAKPRDWERALTRLLGDESMRVDLAGRGREFAATQTVEANCELWWEAWEAAYTRQRKVVLV